VEWTATAQLLVALRLAGYAPAGRVATVAGLDSHTTERALQDLAADGLARYRTDRAAGVAGGWSLTPDGRRAADAALAAELDATGTRPAVESAYRRLLELNPQLLEAVTDWQVRDGRANDHLDRAYDGRMLNRLRLINEKITPVLADLTLALDRFGGYGPRLAAALARARAGEPAYVAGAMIDSYHSVWFELHENLLVTLGRDRSQETTATEVV
jgi:DNA-binding MarR family transcriptional regulator